MIKEELDTDVELERMEDNSRDENPYKELIVNNANKIDSPLTHIEQWSILSNIINYVQHSKNPKNFHSMTIKPAKLNKVVKNTKSRNINESLLEVNLVDSSDRSKEEYLDRYKGVKSEIVDTTRFDENSDLSTTYLANLVEAWYSLEQYIGLKEDKLSSTTVDFIRSEGNLELSAYIASLPFRPDEVHSSG